MKNDNIGGAYAQTNSARHVKDWKLQEMYSLSFRCLQYRRLTPFSSVKSFDNPVITRMGNTMTPHASNFGHSCTIMSYLLPLSDPLDDDALVAGERLDLKLKITPCFSL